MKFDNFSFLYLLIEIRDDYIQVAKKNIRINEKDKIRLDESNKN